MPHQMVHQYFSMNEMYLKTQLKVKFEKKNADALYQTQVIHSAVEILLIDIS